MIKKNQRHLNRILVILDGLVICISLILAWYLRFYSGMFEVDANFLSFEYYIKPLIYIVPSYWLLYYIFKMYKPKRTSSILFEIFDIIKVNIVIVALFITFLYVTKSIHYSRLVIFLFGCINITLSTIERYILRQILHVMRSKGFNQKHLLIVGYSSAAEEYIRHIRNNPQWGYQIYGILDNHKKMNYTYAGIKVIGRLDELDSLIDSINLDEIVVTLNLKDYHQLESIIERCEKSGIFTRLVPDYFKFISKNPYIENLDGLPVISIRDVPLNDYIKRFVKRCIDIVGAIVALILFSPIMITTALITKVTSPGPILFKQERVGLDRKSFMMYKFRSMVVQNSKSSNTVWTTSNDPRITPIGRFIRRTSIDELPQLFNVIKGDMSLIGPRPERPYYVDKFKEEIPKYMIKHQVRPGMTGWAQVHGWRGDTSIKKRIEYDIYYIEHWTLKMDIKIAFLTVFKGFVHRNAY
ncbi:undecaprenyl-phosphate glucose phosphotransferase [Vallitalea okinawensis]|uniref:undecaprenyl-phosphate glucose phosphotransferase n=1 Tax=Vallitalea okinawensis TaxID=2078660 RepID=UPI000CFBC816|nr:undecaprenyl-phosphate glucose phosphotransferase [Vallitalea okinawensis]